MGDLPSRVTCPPGSNFCCYWFPVTTRVITFSEAVSSPVEEFAAANHSFLFEVVVGKESGNGQGSSPKLDWGELGMGPRHWGATATGRSLRVRNSPAGPAFVGPIICPPNLHVLLSEVLPCLQTSYMHSYLMLSFVFKLAHLQVKKKTKQKKK